MDLSFPSRKSFWCLQVVDCFGRYAVGADSCNYALDRKPGISNPKPSASGHRFEIIALLKSLLHIVRRSIQYLLCLKCQNYLEIKRICLTISRLSRSNNCVNLVQGGSFCIAQISLPVNWQALNGCKRYDEPTIWECMATMYVRMARWLLNAFLCSSVTSSSSWHSPPDIWDGCGTYCR